MIPARSQHDRLLHRAACLTAAAALLLPILVGTLVTTTDSGMAIRGWLTADGYPLLTYPWFRAAWDKFLEHGHRLAGIVIGCLTLGLVALSWGRGGRRERRWSAALLIAVIVQGALGGQRVLLDSRGLAMIHGIVASWVFGLMVLFAVVTGQTWERLEMQGRTPRHDVGLAYGMVALVLIQYVLGAFLRHRGTALYEHLGFAMLILAGAAWILAAATWRGVPELTHSARWVAGLAALQACLGLATYVARFGLSEEQFPLLAGWGWTGWAPRALGTEQIVLRSLHVLAGMLLWAAVLRHAALASRSSRTYGAVVNPAARELPPASAGPAMKGAVS